MRQPSQRKEGDIAVAVSRMGHDPIPLCLSEGATVGDALKAAGIRLATNERAYVAGQEAPLTAILEESDVLSIVTPKAAGN